MAKQDMQKAGGPAQQRLPYFDNIKFVLIVCVVLGHALKFGPTNVYGGARALSVFIYSFHMPLFIFLSGLLLNRERMSAQKARDNVLRFLILGYVAKLLRTSVSYVMEGRVRFFLLSEGGLPWYMFAMAAFYGLAWLLRWCDFRLVELASLALSLWAGTVPDIGDFLCLSRIIVFFPFFWLGHALSPKYVISFFAHKGVRVACVAVLVAAAYCCYRWSDELFPYRSLFLGRYGYAACDVEGCTWVTRLLGYGVSLVMGAAVMGVVPQGRIPVVSTLGSRTLWVYLLHYQVLELLAYAGLTKWLTHGPEWHWLVLIPGAFALACLLSLPLPADPLLLVRPKKVE